MDRWREHGHVIEVEVVPVPGVTAGGPCCTADVKNFIEHAPTLVIWRSVGLELVWPIAGANTKHGATIRDAVECGDLLDDVCGMVERGEIHPGAEPHTFGVRADGGEIHEWCGLIFHLRGKRMMTDEAARVAQLVDGLAELECLTIRNRVVGVSEAREGETKFDHRRRLVSLIRTVRIATGRGEVR